MALKCRVSTANSAEFFSGRLFAGGSLPGLYVASRPDRRQLTLTGTGNFAVPCYNMSKV